MSKMIQLRNVPEPLHRKLKVRAAMEGKSLSEYLINEIRRVAERPTVEDLRHRLLNLVPVKLDISTADAVREERDRYNRS